jgi:hypothetical protein
MKAIAATLMVIITAVLNETPLVAQTGTSPLNNATSNSEASISVVNFKSGYRFTTFLNDEPLFYATGLGPLHWEGYPLKSESNEIRIEAVALGEDDSTSIYARIDLESPVEKEIAVVRDKCQGTARLTRHFQFDVPSGSVSANLQYQPIPRDMRVVSNELAKLSLSIISVLNSRDANRVAQLLKMDVATVKSAYPPWYFDASKPATLTRVNDSKDLDVVVGQKFVMVRPSFNYQKLHPDLGLHDVKDSSTGFQISAQCFLFCRINNHWGFFRSGTNSVEVGTDNH